MDIAVIVDPEYKFLDLITHDARGEPQRLLHKVFWPMEDTYDSGNAPAREAQSDCRLLSTSVTHEFVTETYPFTSCVYRFAHIDETREVTFYNVRRSTTYDNGDIESGRCDLTIVSNDAASVEYCMDSDTFCANLVHCDALRVLTTTTRHLRCEIRIYRVDAICAPSVPWNLLPRAYAYGVTLVPVARLGLADLTRSMDTRRATCDDGCACKTCRSVAEISVHDDACTLLQDYADVDDGRDGLLSRLCERQTRDPEWLLTRTLLLPGRDSLSVYIDHGDSEIAYLCLRLRLPSHVEEQIALLYGVANVLGVEPRDMATQSGLETAKWLSTRRRELVARAICMDLDLVARDAFAHFTYNTLMGEELPDHGDDGIVRTLDCVYHNCHNCRENNYSRLSERVLDGTDTQRPAEVLYYQRGEHGIGADALHRSALLGYAHPRYVSGMDEFLQFADASRGVCELRLERVLCE